MIKGLLERVRDVAFFTQYLVSGHDYTGHRILLSLIRTKCQGQYTKTVPTFLEASERDVKLTAMGRGEESRYDKCLFLM